MAKSTANRLASKALRRGISKRIQNAQLSAVHRISKMMARLLPSFPILPFADRLPSAERVINSNFDRGQRLLEQQRQFALGLVEAVQLLRSKRAGPKRRRQQLTRTPRRGKDSASSQ